MTGIIIEPISYAGWPHCYRITNGEVELVVTTEVGPRIIRCGFVGGRNFFAEIPDQLGGSGEPWWMMRGGHRLWVAPEIVPDTYALDNAPVQTTVCCDSITLLQPVEPETGLQKQISVHLAPEGVVKVSHRVTNAASGSRRLAPWALTQMAPGGTALALFPPRGCHEECLLPTNPLVMWAYTDFSDPRWLFRNQYLVLKHNSSLSSPQKAGLFNSKTFGAYLLGTDLFTKRSKADPSAVYPDFQCSFELFANDAFLELETLGPLVSLAPGDSITHVEHWSLHRDVDLGSFTDSELDRTLSPLIHTAYH